MSQQPNASVCVSGVFDDTRAQTFQVLETAARQGSLTVYLWSDALVRKELGQAPKFPEHERRYVLEALRFVARVEMIDSHHAVPPAQNVQNPSLAKFPAPRPLVSPPPPSAPGRKKIVVTGCYDWLHSGHIRFFEEAASYGDLYVIVGSDANVRQLKGPAHPAMAEGERRYCVAAIKYVREAFISTGSGWLDADPEIRVLRPDIYLVNEDGDKGGKREYCAALGLQYLVLHRAPAAGLAARSSAALRGF